MTADFLDGSLASRPIDLSGIENALLDFLLLVEDDVIARLGLHKGTMKLVETEEQTAILAAVVGEMMPEVAAGGSCANVMRMASLLGSRTTYSSAVGDDENGDAFAAGLHEHGVRDRLARVAGATGTSLILVSPDGQRTMNTHLGVGREYRRQFVPREEIEASKIFFTTGYVWDTPNQIEAIEHALEIARGAGVKVALDLADPFAVERSRDVLERHLGLGISVLFANTEEAKALTGIAGAREAAGARAGRVGIAVVTDGGNGAFIGQGDRVLHVPAERVEVVDTTGAGDCFAAGFLHGLAVDLPLQTCGRLATALAADTITRLGVKVSDRARQRAVELVSSAE
ncbi:MAG: adenosine kinase [Thermoanaerobaculia bacterium]|nr:adenosine kinase [Thermoanaerobaculia bacterium]